MQVKNKKYSKLIHDSGENKEHYKMYKTTKGWLFAGITLFTFGAGFTFGPYAVQANDNTSNAENESSVVTSSTSSSSAAASSENSSVASTSSLNAPSNTSANNSSSTSSSTVSKTQNSNSSKNSSTSSSSLSAQSSSSSSSSSSVISDASSATNSTTYNSSSPSSESATASGMKSLSTSTVSSSAVSSGSISSVANGSTSLASTAESSNATPSIGASNSDTSDLSLSAATSVAVSDENISISSTELTATDAVGNVVVIPDDTKQTAAPLMNVRARRTMVAAVSAASAGVKLSENSMGYGTSADGMTITFSFTGSANDVFTITIPANSSVYQLNKNFDTMSTGGTTTFVKNADGSTTITDTLSSTLTETQSFSQTITLDQNSNYLGQPAPMTDIGTTTNTINYTINGTTQTPVLFTQTISPTASLSTPSRTYPTTAVGSVLPNTDYVYNISANEADGVLDNGSKSNQVNSAANFGGTTITIPVPSSFTFDSSLTNSLNGFTDGTTITQPDGKGGNVIITVPAGSGKQNYQTGTDFSYKIAGAYDVAQTASEQTLTASDPATLTQVINAAGDTITSTAADSWTETVLASRDSGEQSADMTAVGNSSSSSTKLLLDNDLTNDPTSLNTFVFSTESANSLTDAIITLNIANGLDATSIQVPSEGATTTSYLPGATSYAYTMTLADGTVEKGTVLVGGTLTPNDSSAIRTVTFTPNFLAAGATSGSIHGTSLLTLSGTGFIVYGTLSSTYDDGSSVNDGDQLASSIEVDINGTTTDTSSTQTVIYPKDTVATVTGYKHQTSEVVGATNAGSLSLAMSGNTGQTANEIYEPVYYFVIPSATTVTGVTNFPDGGVVYEFLADDGREVVKIDYTGTGVSVTTQDTYLIQIDLANNSDAMPGSYEYLMYVTSPETQLTNKTAVTDTSFTDGDANAVLMGDGKGTWTIAAVATLANASLAQGNQDLTAVQDGTSYIGGDQTLTFYDTVLNIVSSKTTNAVSLINLPMVGDSQGSGYTFDLTGPIALPSTYTTGDALTATVLYSTSQQAPGDTVSTAGYMTAEQVSGNWSSVRSIIIEFNAIPSNASTGRIAITGTTTDFNNQAGKTGYLQTAFYADGYVPAISGTDSAAKITILNAPTVALNKQSFTYDGTTNASYASGLVATITLTDGTTQTLSLGSKDITVTNDGKTVNTYTYGLSAIGLSAVQAIIGTTTSLGDPDTTGMINITPYETKALLNNVKISYDGTTKASEAVGLTATMTIATADGATKVVDLNSDDINVISDGVSVNDYVYTLTTTGLAKVQEVVGNNYTVNDNNVTGKISITAGSAAADLTGNEFTYDGTKKASDATGLVATVTLTSGKKTTVDLDSSDITISSGSDSANAGSYTFTLNDNGLAKVQAKIGNGYTVSQGSTGTIIIDKAPVTITAPTVSKSYDGKPYSDDLTASVEGKPTDGADLVYSLTDVSQDVDQGTYPIDVTAVATDNPNYTVSVVAGSLTIKAANASVVLNPGGFAYDGTTKASEADNLTATVNGQTVNLTSSDITVTNDGTASGDYTYSLFPAGLAKVQTAVGNNYTVSDKDVTGTITITPVPANVTFKFVDEQGNTIKADQTLNGNVGDAYDFAAPTIAGYAFASSDQPLSGTITSDNTITLVYKSGTVAQETSAKVTFKFIDEQGKTIKSDEILNSYVGNAYDLTAPTITGYAFVSSDQPLNGKITGDNTITLVYKHGQVAQETPAKVMFKFVDEQGNMIKAGQTLNGYVGNAYDLTAPTIAGYAFVSSDQPLSGTITGDDTITLVYKHGQVAEETPAKVTFKFVDEQGNTIKSDEVLNGYVGNAYDLTAPMIAGYAFVSSDQPLSGKITGDDTITLVYKSGTVAEETPAKVTFKFVDEQGNTIKSDEVLNGYVGNAYDLTAPTIAGYAFASSDQPLNGKITGDNTITLVYKHGQVAEETPAKVTFKFVDEQGNTIKTDQILNGYVGNAYNLMAPTISGYTFLNADGSLSGTITGNETITLVYKAKTSSPNPGGNGGDDTETIPGKTPTDSGKHEGTNTVPSQKSNGSVEKASFSTSSQTNLSANTQTRKTRYHAKAQAKQLPQTGESQRNPLAVIGMSLMAMIFGLFGIKRKKHEQE